MEKVRLDQFLVARGDCSSREKAVQTIKSGRVLVQGKVIAKPSFLVEGEEITVLPAEEYVSRGAFKIKRAYQVFDLSFEGKVVVDIGASTGGFTDVCLQNGAKKIYAVDTGENQLNEQIKNDEKVINMQKTNYLTLNCQSFQDVNFVCIDVSFVSLTKFAKKLYDDFQKVKIVALIKPQFECGLEYAKKHKGIVKDDKIHKKIIENIKKNFINEGFSFKGLTKSPIKGGDGNTEFLIYLEK